MKMEAISFSETSVNFQPATRRYIPEGETLHNHRCEHLKLTVVTKQIKGKNSQKLKSVNARKWEQRSYAVYNINARLVVNL
jgi:hypothetical protein